MITFFLVLLGAALGSFVSVVVTRLNARSGIIAGRSQCPHCNHRLAWYDMVPLASFIVQGGRCRYCGRGISWMYPLLEILGAVVMVLWYWRYGPAVTVSDIGWLGVVYGLVALAVYDIRTFILPDRILAPIAVVALYLALQRGDAIGTVLTGAFLACALFAILYGVSRGSWVGFGDVKLAALIGVLFSYPVALAVVFLAIWLAAGVGAILMVMGRATGRTPLPFGAFLASVAGIAILFINEFRLFTGFIPYIF